MKFNSQICTTMTQSEELLALGLKKETADMYYIDYGSIGLIPQIKDIKTILEEDDIPAWSLHRLIEMCAIPKVPFIRVKFQNTYDEIISLIAEIIKFGAFNKEYLEE